jgi:hypothetical protein
MADPLLLGQKRRKTQRHGRQLVATKLFFFFLAAELVQDELRTVLAKKQSNQFAFLLSLMPRKELDTWYLILDT